MKYISKNKNTLIAEKRRRCYENDKGNLQCHAFGERGYEGRQGAVQGERRDSRRGKERDRQSRKAAEERGKIRKNQIRD